MKDLRKQLDAIDESMRQLFIQRMDLIKDVGQYKKEHNIPVLDSDREKTMLEQGTQKLNHPEYEVYYKEFLEVQLKVSKDLQTKIKED